MPDPRSATSPLACSRLTRRGPTGSRRSSHSPSRSVQWRCSVSPVPAAGRRRRGTGGCRGARRSRRRARSRGRTVAGVPVAPDRPSGGPRSRTPSGATRSATWRSSVHVQHGVVGILVGECRHQEAALRFEPVGQPVRVLGDLEVDLLRRERLARPHDLGRPTVRGAGVAHELRDIPFGARRNAARRGRRSRATAASAAACPVMTGK